MQRVARTAAALTVLIAATALLAAPVAAQGSEVATDGAVDPIAVDARLLALGAAVVPLVSALLLRLNASPAVKRAVPAVLTVLFVAGYYALATWPDQAEVVIGHLLVLLAVVKGAYEAVDGLLESATGRQLNAVTGPGVIGPKRLS